MVLLISSLRTNEQSLSQLTRSLDRLCSKEDQHWKPRIFNQNKSVRRSTNFIVSFSSSFEIEFKKDEVNSHQRNSASIWLRKTSISMHFSLETYALSVELLDRFLATLKVKFYLFFFIEREEKEREKMFFFRFDRNFWNV